MEPVASLSFEPDYEASRDPLRTFLRLKDALNATPCKDVDEDEPCPGDHVRIVCISGTHTITHHAVS
jgi:hypothetical protein